MFCQDFFIKYEEILLRAGLLITLLKVYVDDGRQVTSLLEKGMRYHAEEEKFIWSEEDEQEDRELEERGEDDDSFMARICLPVMNAINPDLKFTAEVAGDFPDRSLPTLDFSMKMKPNQKITHKYYEKEMKTQIMLERESAMGNRQKFCIQGNELTRRLMNIDTELEEDELEEEVVKTIEDYTRQVKNSGWEIKEAREMVVSGFVGWKRRLKRRQA